MIMCLLLVAVESFLNPAPRLVILLLWGLTGMIYAVQVWLEASCHPPMTRLQQWQKNYNEGVEESKRNK